MPGCGLPPLFLRTRHTGYQECYQTGTVRAGRPTHGFGGKIDYLFSSETRLWCVVADSAYSDHHVMIESVSVA